MIKIEGGRGVAAGVRPISWCRLAMVVLALSALLFDFATPLTPTPIAVVHGKTVPKPLIVAAFVAGPIVPIGAFPAAEETVAVLEGRSADFLDLNCSRRC